MKLFLTGLLLLSQLAVMGQVPQKIDTKVAKVIVFPNQAQVTRSANVRLNQGPNELRFTGFPSNLDLSRIQIALGNSQTILEDISYIISPNLPSNSPTEQSVWDAFQAQQKKIQLLELEIKTLTKEEAFLTESLSGMAINIEEVRRISEFYIKRIHELGLKRLDLEADLVKESLILRELRANWDEIKGLKENARGELRLILNAESNSNGLIQISYQDYLAGWEAFYEVKASDFGAPLSVKLKAKLRQNTGLDWNDAQLSLSGSNPNSWNQVPQLSPWTVDFYSPRVYGARGQLDKMEVFQSMDVEISPSEQPSIGESATGMLYQFESPMTIKSAIRPHNLELNAQSLTVDYYYQSVPKLNSQVFLIASIKDWTQVFPISAEAEVYFQNQVTGKTFVSTTNTADELLLSIGAEERIVVKRELVREFSGKRLLANRQTDEQRYKITVINPRDTEIRINIQDQFPISRNSEIEVAWTNSGGGKVDQETGIITWELNLKAGENKEINFGFDLKYPKGKSVSYSWY
jgi:uncharacterized protein (TIGR02231 family)